MTSVEVRTGGEQKKNRNQKSNSLKFQVETDHVKDHFVLMEILTAKKIYFF